jgi:ADP-heptose:LPS heptosyltransferase
MLPAAYREHVVDWMDEVTDFADTAALIDGLDLVISVDTSVAHLAAAMGKPVWLLNRFAGCWRWLRDREDSPWYPRLRLFTQRERGNWDEVLDRIRGELERLGREAPMQAERA